MIGASRIRRVAVVAACLCILVVAAAHAQTPPDSTQSKPAIPWSDSSTSSLLRGGVMGELMAVSVPRSQAEIQRLLDEARGLENTAEYQIQSSEGLAIEAQGRAKIMQEELEVTRARRDAAKKARDKVATAELDATYKKQERQYKYLTQLHDATKADADRLRSAKAAAQATQKSLELELQLYEKQAQLGEN